MSETRRTGSRKASQAKAAPRVWQRMLSGRRRDLLDPSPLEAIVARREPDPRWRLAALLHDGPEYVIGDMISPFKAVMGGDYKTVEKRLQAAIHLRFGLPGELPAPIEKAIKAADRISAYYEATLLAGFDAKEAAKFFGAPGREVVSPEDFAPQPATRMEAAFVERFAERSIDARWRSVDGNRMPNAL